MPRGSKRRAPPPGADPEDNRPTEDDAALFRATVDADPNASRDVSDPEKALFRQSMEGVRPLSENSKAVPVAPKAAPDRKSGAKPRDAVGREPVIKQSQDRRPDGRSDIDRRTADRLRRGHYPIDMKVDLHGLTASQAQTALYAAIQRGWSDGKRCILLVTGKGGQARDPIPERDGWREPRTGVIRSSVPEWIEGSSFRRQVLALVPARREHGGDGAYYLLLRRRRAD